ncbi:hypothetical protein ACFO0M_28370 [Micromonospora mangrovi]|uniref:Uncharacterized protein n=2 Tax=Micromonospora TaxID=1873 RepID=A0AAU7MAD1_9ACTN
MIVASIVLILVAVVLLVVGLAGGSSGLLITSIAASLLAAVALVVGARQAAAARAATTTDRVTGPGGGPRTGFRSAYGPPPAEPETPVPHLPFTARTDDAGWRQPPGPSVADPYSPPAPRDPLAADGSGPFLDAPGPTSPAAGPFGDDPFDAEPPAQRVPPADAARVARLHTEVRVVDGRPRYHLADCPHLVGRDDEALPVAEAVELGFTPCGHCAPDTALLADARPN